MKITFSRHSKRRMLLYNISEVLIRDILLRENPDVITRKEIITRIDNIKYSVKIIFTKEKDCLTIITVYPVKRGNP